jgi:hypothetical protein
MFAAIMPYRSPAVPWNLEIVSVRFQADILTNRCSSESLLSVHLFRRLKEIVSLMFSPTFYLNPRAMKKQAAIYHRRDYFDLIESLSVSIIAA